LAIEICLYVKLVWSAIIVMNQDAIRFGVKDSEGRRSSSWKLWRYRGDVYLAARPAKGAFKISLHESGNWIVSFTSEFVKKAPTYFETKSRHISRQIEPREVERGVTVACRIHIPVSELRMLDEEKGKTTQQIHWVNAPAQGQSIQFLIVISEETAYFEKWPGEADPAIRSIGKISLVTGRSIWVLYRKQCVDPDVYRHIEFARRRRDNGVTLHSKDPIDFTKDSLRLVVIASDELGAVIIIEAALNEKAETAET
jgi:hypothetical protein